MENKEQLGWISHYIGNWILTAAFQVRRGNSGDLIKSDLIKQLQSKGQGQLLEEAITLVEQANWSTTMGVEEFKKAYFKFKEKYK